MNRPDSTGRSICIILVTRLDGPIKSQSLYRPQILRNNHTHINTYTHSRTMCPSCMKTKSFVNFTMTASWRRTRWSGVGLALQRQTKEHNDTIRKGHLRGACKLSEDPNSLETCAKLANLLPGLCKGFFHVGVVAVVLNGRENAAKELFHLVFSLSCFEA